MRFASSFVCLAILLVGCTIPAPLPAPDNTVEPTFTVPSKGSLIVLLPPTQSAGAGMAPAANMMGAQSSAQLSAAGYRVATLDRADYNKLWSQEAAAVGGVFDATTGEQRLQALADALSSLARRVCKEKGCALLVRQRVVLRSAKFAGATAEWDGTRKQVRYSDMPNVGPRLSGTSLALSIELTAITDKGGFAFRRFGGAALHFDINARDVKSEIRKDLFASDKEFAEGVRLALEPLVQ